MSGDQKLGLAIILAFIAIPLLLVALALAAIPLGSKLLIVGAAAAVGAVVAWINY